MSGYYFYSGIWKIVGNLTLYAQWKPKTYTIVLDDRGATSTNHTQTVILTFDKKDSRVNAGMFGKVVLYTEDYSGSVTIPTDSLVQINDKDYVFVVKEGSIVERRAVKTGNSVDGYIQILEGVKEGETVVIQGQTSLADGSKIRDITGRNSYMNDLNPESKDEIKVKEIR